MNLELESIAQFFQLAIHFYPGHTQAKIIKTRLYVIVELLLTKRNKDFNVSMDTDVFLILQIGDFLLLHLWAGCEVSHPFLSLALISN